MTALSHKDKLLLVTEINDNIVTASTAFDDQTKKGFLQLSKFVKDYLTDNSKINKLGSYQLKSLTSEILTYLE